MAMTFVQSVTNVKSVTEQGENPMASANERQIGGEHYKKHGASGEQHWDRVWRIYGKEKAYVYFVAAITKYVERYRDKNGIQDLEKARHYLDKLIELENKHASEPLSASGPTNAMPPTGDHPGGSPCARQP